MRTLALLLLLAAPACAAAPAAKKCEPQKVPAAKKIAMTMPDGKKVKIDLVDTPATREIGLMCVRKMPRDYGMLFAFPQDMHLGFWMKNTLVPLDIIWIGADKRITVIHERLPASTVDTPDDKVATAAGRGQFVLELAAGEADRRALKPGDLLKFEAPIPAK
ncbi:MAG: DUF192 domain-containing protein [Elusimicrobiota bacterium]|nr:MAG: DUF192 domain-containing protein [Elusimicrobiota bacterium]